MKAAKLTEHPSFRLMRQTDVQNVWHMQMPRWLFSDPRYADMSLDAKVTYTFLLNRFQLSRRKNRLILEKIVKFFRKMGLSALVNALKIRYNDTNFESSK